MTVRSGFDKAQLADIEYLETGLMTCLQEYANITDEKTEEELQYVISAFVDILIVGEYIE